MPIDGKYESWKHAIHYEYGKISDLSVTLIFLPLAIALIPFRMLAMHTSKLPLWDKEIEAANIIEADDPYVKYSRINPEGLR